MCRACVAALSRVDPDPRHAATDLRRTRDTPKSGITAGQAICDTRDT